MKDDMKYGGKTQTLEANTARVSTLVGMAADDMERATTGEKIPLDDIERIKDIGTSYLRECATAGILPTVRGVASRLGCTRQALYYLAKEHPNGALAKWLADFSDLCGEITMSAAMEGTVAAVPAIFVAKSRYEWREAPAQVEIGRLNLLSNTYGEDTEETARLIAAKYAELPSD